MTDYAIDLKQWAPFELPITVTNPAVGITPATPVDLTGAIAKGAIFKGFKADTEYPFTFEFAADRTTGQLSATLEVAQTGVIPYGLYRYEILVLSALGKEVFRLEGDATVAAGRQHG